MKTIPAFLLLLAPLSATAQSANTPPFYTTGAFIALSVADLEASARWYTEKFGLRVALQPPPSGSVSARILEGGGLIVELIHNPAAVPLSKAAPTITHTTLVHGIFKAGLIVDNYNADTRGIARAWCGDRDWSFPGAQWAACELHRSRQRGEPDSVLRARTLNKKAAAPVRARPLSFTR